MPRGRDSAAFRADFGTPVKGRAAKGHTVKHTKKATAKHHSAKVKHAPAHHAKAATHHKATVHAKAKHPAHAKATGLALAPGDVACCGAEALAASLRLGGLSVTDAEMLDLFWLAGGHPDKGIPIPELLEAAREYGLAGVRPSFESVDLEEVRHGRRLILAAELPGPHAVLATPEGWWSWGELWCPCEFPDAVIEEAWAVTWAAAS